MEEVAFSAGRLQIDGLPSDRALYFRVSGIDSIGSVVWTSTGGVPGDQKANVSIGTNGGFQPKTVATPTVQSTAITLSPRVTCQSGTWPAWTVDGSIPSESNPATRSDFAQSQTTVNLNPTESLKARCTDHFTWSSVAEYKPATTSASFPTPSGPGTDFTLAPDLNIPGTSPGTIQISANTSSFPGYSSWKVVYRQKSAAQWNVMDLNGSVGVSFNGTGTIDAYLGAWNGTKWVTGKAVTANYPNAQAQPLPTIIPSGLVFPAPAIQIPSVLPGNVTFNADTSYSGYSSWKVIVQTSNMASPVLLNAQGANQFIQGTGTVTAYLMAWDGTNWVAGYSGTAP